MMSYKTLFKLVVVSALILAFAACEAKMETPTTTTTTYPLLSEVAPPPTMYEDKPINEHPRDTTWRAGYWSYNGGSFSWVPGEYVAKPSGTAVWAPGRWARHQYGWGFVPGHWQ